MSFTPEEVTKAWDDAIAVWGVAVTLRPPVAAPRIGTARDPLAYIDLETREIVVSFSLLERIGARTSLPAVLAHELGHHVRFPHTLALVADLMVLEKQLVPGLGQSLTNLFFDLQVNEVVGRTRAAELAAVYRGSARVHGARPDPLFTFYLAVYEELWGLEEVSLSEGRRPPGMDATYPGWRADARMFAQTFYALDETYLQFIYFCSVFIRYVPDPTSLAFRFPLAGDVPLPTPDDFASAGQSERRDRAVDEALRRGWVTDGEAARARGEDGMAPIKRVASGMPGTENVPFELRKEHEAYRALVERYLIEPPPVATPPDPYLPGTLEEWQVGDNPRGIDWVQTVLARGPLAAAAPLARELLPDDAGTLAQDLPAMEIYLDTSGSMPQPGQRNFLTLAAQILAVSTCRKGGMVRGIIYSWECLLSDWMRHEDVARRFFFGYSGGGTAFPFALMKKLARERSDVIRVVISDGDFLANVLWERELDRQKAHLWKLPEGRDALAQGVAASRLFVALLALDAQGTKNAEQVFGSLTASEKFRLVVVPDVGAMARAAADLSRAILGPARSPLAS